MFDFDYVEEQLSVQKNVSETPCPEFVDQGVY